MNKLEFKPDIDNETGQIVYSLHQKRGVVFVFHTAMFRRGFAARNGSAKGFGGLLEIHRRPTTLNDNRYFLGWCRAKWEVYDSVRMLMTDEEQFCPDGVADLKAALIQYSLLPKAMKTTLLKL